MKQRLEATHFIEVWKGVITGRIYSDTPKHIGFLSLIKKSTKFLTSTTIAIWKIKYK